VKLYLDSSALVKLVQREPESAALRRFLRDAEADQLVTSTLARVEVVRAVSSGGARAVSHARRQLARLDQIVLNVELLDRAAELPPSVPLRSFDAIHIAAAQLAGEQLRALITYDRRMADAARALGIAVESPS
jgi:predicted nucleic acid-binding protein